jgi:hypothetical protein
MMLKDIPLAPVRTLRNALRERLGRRVEPTDVALGQPFLTE